MTIYLTLSLCTFNLYCIVESTVSKSLYLRKTNPRLWFACFAVLSAFHPGYSNHLLKQCFFSHKISLNYPWISSYKISETLISLSVKIGYWNSIMLTIQSGTKYTYLHKCSDLVIRLVMLAYYNNQYIGKAKIVSYEMRSAGLG